MDEPTHVGKYTMRARNNQSMRFTGKNSTAIKAFVNRYKTAEAHEANMLIDMQPTTVVRVTNRDVALSLTLRPGDHLVLSDTGTFYSMPDLVWNLTYNKG